MRTQKDIFREEGFTIEENKKESNPLLEYIRKHHPDIIRDNEIDLQALKSILGLPVDSKVNGYGLNFIGRNVGRAKYARETDQELKVNPKLSVDFDHTQNMVLKGDNLDTLKILKSHYSGRIKCIYIDPPYNTDRDEFLYPDRWDQEEQEVLGLAHLTPEDMERMEFSFKTKKSHNGWLTFMYPRLLLARDLLTQDGVIFISIDDNEQANLKLLCDEIFGEENFVANIIWEKAFAPINLKKHFSESHDYLLCYSNNKNITINHGIPRSEENLNRYQNPDNDPRGPWQSDNLSVGPIVKEKVYEIITPSGRKIMPPNGYCWRLSKSRLQEFIKDNRIWFGEDGNNVPRIKRFLSEVKTTVTPMTIWKFSEVGHSQNASQKLKSLFDGKDCFNYPKPINLIKRAIKLYSKKEDIILDFFAGSGTTGHAVMQLNAEDGGNRRFILCQIDEPIQEDHPAFQFCKDQELDPVISSITIERLRRAGEKIRSEIKENHQQTDLFEENKKSIPDLGFKVFDTVPAPALELTDGEIHFHNMDNDPLSRIYNMIFSVGIDPPTAPLECIKENCIYRIGDHYYITRSKEVTHEELSQAINNGKVFIDGWTATINATLQHFKEDVKIVF